MNFLYRVQNALLFDTTIDDPERKVSKQIWEDNRGFAIIWSIAQIIYWGFCLFMSFREYRFTLCRNVYITAMIISVVSLVLSVAFVRKIPRLIHLVKVMVYGAIFGGGIFIAWILLQNDIKTIMIFASVLLVPTLFVSNTLSNIIVVLIDIIAASILLRNGLSPEVYRWCITDLVIFSTIGVTLGHFVNKARFERYVFAESAVQLAESNAKLAELQTRYAYYDQMTGLRNRRSYSEMVEQLSEELPENCCVIMADINGLKETNDTLGHEAGDELIIGYAECLKNGFDGIDTIYRIGGDELCLILINSDIDVEECIRKTENSCESWRGHFVRDISFSYGLASTDEFSDLKSILSAADRRMYESKNNYYLSAGKERRKY